MTRIPTMWEKVDSSPFHILSACVNIGRDAFMINCHAMDWLDKINSYCGSSVLCMNCIVTGDEY